MSREIKRAEVPPGKEKEKIDTVIAHWSLFAPGKSGLCETTKELVIYENQIKGVLAGFVDANTPESNKVFPGTNIAIQSHEWAIRKANIHMIHYSHPLLVKYLKPKVYMIHGSPESCLYAQMHNPAGHAMTASLNWIQDCEATIVFLKRHYHIWKAFDRNSKLHYVPKGIDLKRWNPMGSKMDLKGEPAILYGEIWRAMKDPFTTMFALEEYYKRNLKMLFHPWGAMQYFRVWEAIVNKGPFSHFLGQFGISQKQNFPEHWYRGGDLLISPVNLGEPSRTAKEALACGCPVIGWDSNPFSDLHVNKLAKAFNFFDMADKIEELWNEIQNDERKVREQARALAEKYYDMKVMAKQVVEISRKVIEEASVQPVTGTKLPVKTEKEVK